MRLGFAVKVLGREGLKSNDSRRWQSGPHLSVSISYLHAIFDYLAEASISMYRISSEIAPYITHPDLPQFHNQLDECRRDLMKLGEKARRLSLRLSMHPSQYIVLNSPVESVYESAVRDFVYHTQFLDAMGLGREAVVVTHGGGVYGDKPAAIDRFVERYHRLPESVRARLVLENDEKNYSVPDIVQIHERTGIPLVLDNLHHAVNNPAGMSYTEAARLCLTTWPRAVKPKVHYSTPRTEERTVNRRNRKTGEVTQVQAAPLASQHADWINVDEFIGFLHETEQFDYDVMLEAKQKDLALLRLRTELRERGIATE
ncbi:MAG: UV DNA damage repair endonuclease UvsE [Chloroflexota bacterium]|nr:UV DNA damage repair endonuclease UvsE [Chloroflexota bacterium]